jgi:chitinase
MINLLHFIYSWNLDGVDIDWEYPGEPDIPGIPASTQQDAQNYLEFLRLLREALRKDKTVLIVAPASHWYLRAYPIREIAEVVDYIIYMTYDLHGQWDYGNKWSTPGCSGANCLRSHINMTETFNALSMITKAGVPSKKAGAWCHEPWEIFQNDGAWMQWPRLHLSRSCLSSGKREMHQCRWLPGSR